jgi:predicted secreted hydrolase
MQPRAATYASFATHATYPIQWYVTVPSLRLELDIHTPLPSPELVSRASKRLTYWEGQL